MKFKARLGRKDIFTENKAAIKPEKQITRIPESQKRIKVTFQIPEKLFSQIKIKAAEERKRISDLVGEIFNEYLAKK